MNGADGFPPSVIPIVLFYGTGILRKADFDHSPWSTFLRLSCLRSLTIDAGIVFLAMGGIGLGKAVLSSGLLDDMDAIIQQGVLGLDIWPILALFSVIVLVIATLISHTSVLPSISSFQSLMIEYAVSRPFSWSLSQRRLESRWKCLTRGC